MKKPTIQPVGDIILMKIEQANLGALDTSSMKTGVEWATIVALGPEVQGSYKVGDKIFVKAWGVDSIFYENEDYHFTSEARKAICAIIK
jgi:co-chaperonin GroES (HSP10)